MRPTTPAPVVTLVLAVTVWMAGAREARGQTPGTSDAFTLSPRAFVQFDLRGFPDWNVTPGQGRVARDTVEARRIRLGADGTWKRLGYEISVDASDTGSAVVKDAYAQVRWSPALRLRAGQFKVPGTREFGVSARALDFLERSPLVALGVARDRGARLDGRIARLSYDVGLFAGDGVNRNDRAGVTTAGRAVLDLPNGFEIGGSVSGARTRARDADPPNGPSIASPAGYRFADGVYVQGTRLRLGADVQWTPGNWRLAAEGLRLRDPRHGQGLDGEDLPAAIHTGFTAAVIRRVRERRQPGGSPLATALLRRPIDVGLRYDYIAIDDAGAPAPIDSVRPRATNIRPRAVHGVTLGSTWSAAPWIKVLGNVGLERFTDARSAPEAGRAGTYVTLAARLQIELP